MPPDAAEWLALAPSADRGRGEPPTRKPSMNLARRLVPPWNETDSERLGECPFQDRSRLAAMRSERQGYPSMACAPLSSEASQVRCVAFPREISGRRAPALQQQHLLVEVEVEVHRFCMVSALHVHLFFLFCSNGLQRHHVFCRDFRKHKSVLKAASFASIACVCRHAARTP